VTVARVFADFEFSLEASPASAEGSNCGHLRADGSSIVVTMDDPAALATLAHSTGRTSVVRGVRQLARSLAQQQLTLSIVGQRGPIVHLGGESRGHIKLGRLRDGYPRVALRSLLAFRKRG
jgi:hypothetical protein